MKWGGEGGGSLRDLSKNILKQEVGKGKSCSQEEGSLKVSPPLPPPPENFNQTHGNGVHVHGHTSVIPRVRLLFAAVVARIERHSVLDESSDCKLYTNN